MALLIKVDKDHKTGAGPEITNPEEGEAPEDT